MKLLLERLLALNYYSLNQHDVSLQLLSHPDYPSLKSLTDTLDHFKVENAALQVQPDLLYSLPTTFIAQVNRENHLETVLVNRSAESVRITNYQGQHTKATVDQFKRDWNGNTILVEPLPRKTLNVGLLPAVIALLFAFLILFLQWLHFQPAAFFSLIALLSGLGMASFVFLNEHGTATPFLDKVCKAVSENSNCTEVTKDKQGKLFRGFGLSDLSLVMFVSLVVTQLIAGWEPMLGVGLSLFILPVILYSLYLQVIVIKKWCFLCLAISALLLIYTGVSYWSAIGQPMAFQIFYLIKFVFTISLVGLTWFALRTFFDKYDALEKIEREYLQFKRNIDTFISLLLREKKVRPMVDDISKLIFGNPDAEIEFVAVTNPLCGFCRDAFYEYKQLIDRAGDHVKLKIIFNVATRESSEALLISNRLISIYLHEGKTKCWSALEAWFNSRDIIAWNNTYSSDKLMDTTTVSHHYQWCQTNELHYTPATIIDGYLYPNAYKVSEFILLIDDYLETKRTKIN